MWQRRETMTEAELQNAVIDLCKLLNYSYYHTYNSRRSVAGFPDLVLVKDRIIFVELKSEKGRLSPAQAQWRDDIQGAGGEWYLVRPTGLADFAKVLQRPRDTTIAGSHGEADSKSMERVILPE